MKVNGVEVLNFRYLRQFVEECCVEQLSFDLENGNVIVENCKFVKEEILLMLEYYGIWLVLLKDFMKEVSELVFFVVV